MTARRLRMFAGPNGSGKSTIKSIISSNLLGHYLNPDDIEKQVRQQGYYDLRSLDIRTDQEEILAFFKNHPLAARLEDFDLLYGIRYIDKGFIDFADVGFNSYLSAILTDFLRHKLLDSGQSFTFETVMSSADKVLLLQKAQELGYRTYLYYVATEDPFINLSRIRHRVRQGGHPVPDEKVVERYYRSLRLLSEAIRATNRAYLFDNSGESKVWVAEITAGTDVVIKTDRLPEWVRKYVLETQEKI